MAEFRECIHGYLLVLFLLCKIHSFTTNLLLMENSPRLNVSQWIYVSLSKWKRWLLLFHEFSCVSFSMKCGGEMGISGLWCDPVSRENCWEKLRIHFIMFYHLPKILFIQFRSGVFIAYHISKHYSLFWSESFSIESAYFSYS